MIRCGAREVARIACNLLPDCDRLQKVVAVQNMPGEYTAAGFQIVQDKDDYAFCQVIKELPEAKADRGCT